MLGKTGVEKIVELNLNADECKELDVSVSHVKDLVAKVDKLL